MDPYVGLDVSLKETSISVRQDRKRIWRGKCPSHPKAVIEAISKHAPAALLVVFETGPRATWVHRSLAAEGLPAVGIEQGMRRRPSIRRRTRLIAFPLFPSGGKVLLETPRFLAGAWAEQLR